MVQCSVSVVQGVLSYGIVRGVPVRWCGYQRVFSLPPVLAYRMVALLAGYRYPRPAGFGAARPVSVWSGVATWLTAAPPRGFVIDSEGLHFDPARSVGEITPSFLEAPLSLLLSSVGALWAVL